MSAPDFGVGQLVSIGNGLDDRGSKPGRGNEGIFFLFTTASRPVLGPNQQPVPRVSEVLSQGKKQPGREADHSPHLLLRFRMRGATPPLPDMSLWRGA